jgi:hypothetical protein
MDIIFFYFLDLFRSLKHTSATHVHDTYDNASIPSSVGDLWITIVVSTEQAILPLARHTQPFSLLTGSLAGLRATRTWLRQTHTRQRIRRVDDGVISLCEGLVKMKKTQHILVIYYYYVVTCQTACSLAG